MTNRCDYKFFFNFIRDTNTNTNVSTIWIFTLIDNVSAILSSYLYIIYIYIYMRIIAQ